MKYSRYFQPCLLSLLAGVFATAIIAYSQPIEEGQASKSVGNLHQIAIAMIIYAQDYEDHLPPMENAATAQKALAPYVQSNDVFFSPETKEPFLPNPALSNRAFVNPNPIKTKVVAFYQANPGADGKRYVLFLPREGEEKKSDYVKSLSSFEWNKLKHDAKLP